MNHLVRFTLRGQDRLFNVENEIEDVVQEQCVDGEVSIITLRNGRQIFVDQTPAEIYQVLRMTGEMTGKKIKFANNTEKKNDE